MWWCKVASDDNRKSKVGQRMKRKVSEEKLMAENCARWEDMRDEKLNEKMLEWKQKRWT